MVSEPDPEPLGRIRLGKKFRSQPSPDKFDTAFYQCFASSCPQIQAQKWGSRGSVLKHSVQSLHKCLPTPRKQPRNGGLLCCRKFMVDEDFFLFGVYKLCNFLGQPFYKYLFTYCAFCKHTCSIYFNDDDDQNLIYFKKQLTVH